MHISVAVGRPPRWLTVVLLALVLLPAVRAEDKLQEEKDLLYSSMGKAEDCGIARMMVIRAIDEDRVDFAMDALKTFLKKGVPNKNPELLTETELEAFGTAAECLSFMALCSTEQVYPDPEVCRWLLGTNARLSAVVNNLDAQDDWRSVVALLNDLYRHDTEGRDRYFNLILAMALVWDQPNRPRVHHQTGSPLAYDAAILSRYDFFRDLYQSQKAKLAYEKLSVRGLVFVVGAGVPLSELQWGRDHVGGRASSWDRKYAQIVYDDERYEKSILNWPHGDYTLEAIEDKGGICIDQAYYAGISAQANGIPAMIFTGTGKRGAHAWVGVMKDENTWEMNVGRYTYDAYCTGSTIDPQTNSAMTDHAVAFAAQRALQRPSYDKAVRLANIGFMLLRLDEERKARRFAGVANEMVPAYDKPWRIMEEMLKAHDETDRLVVFYEGKAESFAEYPDVRLECAQSICPLLSKAKRQEEAVVILDRYTKKMPEYRTDLIWQLAELKVQMLKELGKNAEVTKAYEEALWESRHEGEKLGELMRTYIAHQREIGELEKGVDFVDKVTDRMQDKYKMQFGYFVADLYAEIGDDRKADRIRTRTERYFKRGGD